MQKLTIKDLVLKSSIFEREEFKDALKAGQREWDGHLSNHLISGNYELIQTTDGQCEIVLIYKDGDTTYELYRDTLYLPEDSAFFDRYMDEVDYMFDVYETAEFETSMKHSM